MRGDDTFEEQDYLFDQLSPPFRRKEDMWALWHRYQRPLVEWIVAKIESLRTPQWQCARDRIPAALKNTYSMRLWLLTYPSMPWLSDHAEKRNTFVTELAAELMSLTESNRPYHHKFPVLKHAALQAWPTDFCYLASKLGSVDGLVMSELNSTDLLRIELADVLLKNAAEPKDHSDIRKTQVLLASWRASDCEDVRMMGLSTTRLLSQPKDGKRLWFSENVA